jgi:protein-L-isoaspartate(D-aspartate) O-methyltransferase
MSQQDVQRSKPSPLDQMVQSQLIDRGIRDERVIAAMRTVPRDRFFPKAAGKSDAFAGRAAPIGWGQTISEPYIVALMTEKLDVQPGMKVLEIGTGSGYQTAVLCRLAGDVFSVERVKPLLDEAFERLMDLGLRNVHFRYGDGTEGWADGGPFDRVLIAAGAPEIPRKLLLSQLKDGGVAVLPYGPDDEQVLVRVVRRGNDLHVGEICACRFVKLIGREGWAEE